MNMVESTHSVSLLDQQEQHLNKLLSQLESLEFTQDSSLKLFINDMVKKADGEYLSIKKEIESHERQIQVLRGRAMACYHSREKIIEILNQYVHTQLKSVDERTNEERLSGKKGPSPEDFAEKQDELAKEISKTASLYHEGAFKARTLLRELKGLYNSDAYEWTDEHFEMLKGGELPPSVRKWAEHERLQRSKRSRTQTSGES